MKFKSIFEEIANKWNENESSYFLKQEDSKNFFKLELIGNKRTGYQIKDWISPASKKVEKLLQNWDGRTELKFDIPEFGSINDFHDLLNDNNVPDNLPEIGQMELFKSSKLTDFINGSFLEQYGLLINEKTKNLLIKFNLGKYKSYTFQVIYKDSANLDYYFLRNAASIDKFIDYKKSKFYSQEGLLEFDKRNNLELNSLEEINNYKEKVKNKDIYIFASEIYLNNDFPNYDLFKCNIYGIHGVYISKELKDSLENSSGVIIRTTNRIKN